MKILFHTNQLDYRGTTDQVYKYAHYCETILGHVCGIAYPTGADESSLWMFEKRFEGRVYAYDSLFNLEDWVWFEDIDVIYYIRYGTEDFLLNTKAKQVVHSVFNVDEPHSDQYAYVSKWLSEQNSNAPFVPHIVELPAVSEDYREFLGIPKDATVVCRHGGNDTFDIDYVQNSVYKIALANPGMYFLLLNTDPFCPILPNIIHLAPTTDKSSIASFLATGDIYLHARERGESFGIAVCEALAANLPVITYINGVDRHHIQLMGDNGFYYSSSAELEAILLNFKRPEYNYRNLVKQFSPEKVMPIFEEVFLK